MKLLVVTQYFWPETFRINEICEDLSHGGHQVTVLTGIPNYPRGHFFEGFGMRGPFRQNWKGVKIIRAPLVSRGSNKGWRLALNYLSFAFFGTCAAFLFCRERYDAILTYVPSPITGGLPGVLLGRLRKIPVLFWVQDLWPESLSATGAVKSGLILNLTGKLVSWIYANSSLVLGQSPAFEPAIRAWGVPAEKVSYLPGSADRIFETKKIAEDPEVEAALRPIPPGFWVLFAGNIGQAQSFETLLEAASELKGERDIHWIILGEGRMLKESRATCKSLGIEDHVHFLGRFAPDKMPAFFARADVLVATLRNQSIFSKTVPSRIHAYLASGKPIIASIGGETARVIREAEAGLTPSPEDGKALADSVLKIKALPGTTRAAMGVNALSYYETHFSSGLVLSRLEHLFAQTLEGENIKSP